MNNSSKQVYCICYLDKKAWRDLEKHIKASKYAGYLKPFVPTVELLIKTHKGRDILERRPLLFNYGFIRMPRKWAFSRSKLKDIQRNIPGIHSWLKDTITLHERKKKARIDNVDIWDDFSIVAICPKSEIRRFKKMSENNKKYSSEDLVRFKKGDYITLKGYPYEGMGATIRDINYKEKTVTVEVVIFNGVMKLKLPFDNVLYSIYQNYDPDLIYASPLEESQKITQEKLINLMDLKQY